MQGLNNQANMLRYSSGGGSGGSSGPSKPDTLFALAQLQGLNIGRSLLVGIQTGTSPIDTLMQQLNKDIGEKAQPIADQFRSIFDTALQYGQQASASLIPNVISGLPQMGTVTNVTVGKDGKLVSSVQSPILGGLRSTLATDQQFVTDIGKAKKLGLSSTILGQFVQAGPSSLSQLDQLVNGSPDDIASINSTFGQITSLGNQYGLQQAMAESLSAISGKLDGLIKALITVVPSEIGRNVGDVINGAAKKGQQSAHATPSLGIFAR
jgi:hypothetical protein